MTDDEKTMVIQALSAIAELYGKQLSTAHLAVFCEAVSDLDGQAVKDAIAQLARTGKFFPLPADVRETVLGSSPERALMAWSRVEKAMTSAGPYASVRFDDPVLHVTITQLGGWPALCGALRLDERDYSFRRRDFLQTYELFARRGHGPALAVLPGLHEEQNMLTRGQWTRGLGHVDEVLAIGPHGEVKETIALPAPKPALEAPRG